MLKMPILPNTFFDGDACAVARYLLGKVIRHKYNGIWLAARIIETEAYYKHERGSHASLGYTDKRKGASKNSNFFVRARKHRAQNRSV